MTETVNDGVLKLATHYNFLLGDDTVLRAAYCDDVLVERESVRELLDFIFRYTVFHRKPEDCGCPHCRSGIRIRKVIEELKTK